MDNDIFCGYVRLFRGAAYRLAYSFLRNAADADDVCQDAFIKLLDFEGSFPTDEDCRRWLFRVVANLSKNLLKSCRFTRTEELNDDIPFEREEDKELWALVKSLPAEYGAVIHLYYYEGYSVKEISHILSISVTAVTSRLSRGRKRLKNLLEEGNL